MSKDNKYFAEKMREYRKRLKEVDKHFYKKQYYTIELNGKKYLFLNRQDVKISKIFKQDITPEYIKTF